MKNYKYSVVTTNFGNYEDIKEVSNPVDDVEYIIVTDNPALKYNTWKTVLFDDYDKLAFPDLAWIYVKWFTFKYCSCDICLYIDGSIKINNDFSELVQYFLNNNYEYAATIENNYMYADDMFSLWAKRNYHGYTNEAHHSSIEYLKSIGYDPNKPGLINTAFLLKRKTELTQKIDKTVWDILSRNGKASYMEYRIMEPAFTHSLNIHAYNSNKILILDHNIKYSDWFTWMFHKSNKSTSVLYNMSQAEYFYADFKWIFQDKIIQPISYIDITYKRQIMPLLTIVITAYNKENTIKRTINSVRQMSYSNWECIIVDNNSTDNTQNIILDAIEYDDRFVYVRQKNKNVCNARNVGAFLGNGKYLLHIDGDDTIGKYFCEYGINALEKNEQYCIATGAFNRIYQQNNTIGVIIDAASEFNSMDPVNRMKSVCSEGIFIVESIIKMSTFKKINGFREGIEQFQEDWEMFIRYFDCEFPNNNVFYMYNEITANLYEQTYSKTSITEQNTKKNIKEFYKFNKKIYEKYFTKEEIENIEQ